MSNTVTEWYTIYSELEAKKKETSELKKKFKLVSDALISQLKESEFKTVELENGKKLQLNEKTTFSSLNEEHIYNSVEEYISSNSLKKSNDLAEKITGLIMEKRSSKVNYSLKILKK